MALFPIYNRSNLISAPISCVNILAENQKKPKEEKNDYIKEESKVASERDRKLSEDKANKTRK
ncbi:MAG: hypothetical protein AB8B72_07745 [Crocinitomicaceae bacterium]